MEGSHPEQIHLTDLNRHALTNAWISMEPLSAAKPKVLLKGEPKKKNSTKKSTGAVVFLCEWFKFKKRNVKKE